MVSCTAHLVHTIRHHHDAEIDEKGDVRAELIQVCQLSDAIAQRIASGWAPSPKESLIAWS